MTGNDYQKAAMRTLNKRLTWSEMLADGAMGLAGEAGECADIVKKYLYQGHELDPARLREELGDLMWYVAVTAAILSIPLDTVMEANVEKLKRRYPEGFSEEASINRKE